MKAGAVITECGDRHRAVELRKFLSRIDEAVPADLGVHLILDHSSTHMTPAVRSWLLKQPRLHLHFTPDELRLAQPAPHASGIRRGAAGRNGGVTGKLYGIRGRGWGVEAPAKESGSAILPRRLGAVRTCIIWQDRIVG